MSKETPESVTVSSALQFKQAREAREAGDVLTLTGSGLTVRLKRPEVTQIIAKGLIPQQMVQRFMNLQGKAQSAVKAEDVEAILGFQREMAKHAFIEPRIVESPDYGKNEISIDDLDPQDIDDVWAYVNGGITAVELFRKERNAGLSAGPASETVPEQTTE